ncbi:MAG: Wzz/FepE/Etk N-terminal domain-containing protein [Coriobacteriia bacterium]|nr:Wzz/FepE/Etk N-terminal domain-containing protein [Coriobacteriia bacterium]
METWDWVPFLKRRKVSIAVVTVLTVAVTMAVTFIVPPTYQSIAILMVQPLTDGQPLANPTAVQLVARNMGELVKNPAVEKAAAKALGRAGLQGEPEYRVTEGTGLVQVIVVGTSPEQSAKEANALAAAFIMEKGRMLEKMTVSSNAMIEQQLASLRQQIADTEVKLNEARQVTDGEGEVDAIQESLDSLKTAYEGVLFESQQLPKARATLSTSIQQIVEAVPEPEQVSPRPALNLGLAIVGGMLLGIAYARATD